jgi:hypothetical protein
MAVVAILQQLALHQL